MRRAEHLPFCHTSIIWRNSSDQYSRPGKPAWYNNEIFYWYLNCKRHRGNGPAVLLVKLDKYWYFNDLLHREDGPAIELDTGKYQGWYKNGVGTHYCQGGQWTYLPAYRIYYEKM